MQNMLALALWLGTWRPIKLSHSQNFVALGFMAWYMEISKVFPTQAHVRLVTLGWIVSEMMFKIKVNAWIDGQMHVTDAKRTPVP